MADDSTRVERAHREERSDAVVQATAVFNAYSRRLSGAAEADSGPKSIYRWESSSLRLGGHRGIGIEYDGRNLILAGVWHWGKKRQIDRLWVTAWPVPPTAESLSKHLIEFAPQGRQSVDVVATTQRAMVRHFHIPPVSARHREEAARWEGQKLIPFPMKEGETLFGMDFVRDGDKGWWVTLVALPREDSAPILEGIHRLGWRVRSVSLAGTQRQAASGKKAQPEGRSVTAVVLWSSRRGSFTAFSGKRLKFQYDLGPMPPPPFDPAQGMQPENLRAWLDELGTLLADPFDFCLNQRPGFTPTHLELTGIPEEVAPLVSDWNERFGTSVAVMDPTSGMTAKLPEKPRHWIRANVGLVAPAALAAAGYARIDCAPEAARRERKQHQFSRIARSFFTVSAVITVVWAGMLWKGVRLADRALETGKAEFTQLDKSPALGHVREHLGLLAQRRKLFATLQELPRRWMPWAKTVLKTLPDNATLMKFEILLDSPGHPGGSPDGTGELTEATLTVRLIGTLSPEGPPHGLNYRIWLHALNQLVGPNSQPRLQARSIPWKGRVRSAFSIELSPPLSSVTGGRA